MKNIFSKLPTAKKAEVFETLLREGNVKIERITTLGQKTPDGAWLKEKTAEWVILLRGKARLSFADSSTFRKPSLDFARDKKGLPCGQCGKTILMKPGDYVFIPAGAKHRVEWTTPSQATVWLAVHIKN